MTTRRSLVSALVLALATSSAAAQSRRYPPAPVDKDAENAQKSDLWSSAVTPERHHYLELVRTAKEAMTMRTFDQTTGAIEKLGEAIQLLPKEPEAYRLRGEAYYDRRDWDKCAADFAAADANTQRDDEPAHVMIDLRRKLGVCQAHAGKLAEAEQTLTEDVASSVAISNGAGETWLRLGEVRIALGKLDEAIAALRAALDSTEASATALTHFLLAEAYDRARRPADALIEAGEGMRLDRSLSVLFNPVLPALGNGDYDYMLGLAYSADPPRPELTLAYFRRYVKAAPDSPWRRRAEEHLRELRGTVFPDWADHNGTAPVEPEAIRGAGRPMMPQMRACLSKFPTTVVQVEVARLGPRTPATDRTRPRFFMPSEGVAVHRAVGELSDSELDAIEACLKPYLGRLALPAVKERDTYYKASFYVIGP